MNPKISKLRENDDELKFTLSDVDKSIANSIRRTILANIKTIVIDVDKANFEYNNTRLHNEILKERLRAIPVHFNKNIEQHVGKYIIELDKQNDTENIMTITTDDFKIKSIETGTYVDEKTRNTIFPKNKITGCPILFARLDALMDTTIEKSHVKFNAPLIIQTGHDNASCVVASTCSYMNTLDDLKIKETWDKRESVIRSELEKLNTESVEIQSRVQFERNDFMYLDAQRLFIPNSFDFIIETIGVFSNKVLVRKACIELCNSFITFNEDLDKNNIQIEKSIFMKSHSTIENSYDIVLDEKDNTFGCVLEFILYSQFFGKDKELSFVGFDKSHPHYHHSFIRIAFHAKTEMETIKNQLKNASTTASQIFTDIHKHFN